MQNKSLNSRPNYKKTLNLPKTKFPMRANLSANEPAYIKKWDKMNLYEKIKIKNKGKETCIIQDGPPYANGNIHIGHALNKILKDFIFKYKILEDIDVSYVPGWDCHGLPIELKTEKTLGKKKHNIENHEFRAFCRSYAQSQVNLQKSSFRRLGVVGDWDNTYSTMQFSFESETVKALADIVNNGHVKSGHKPVHWCIKCRSSLSEAEVEYRDKESNSLDILYKVLNKGKIEGILKRNLESSIGLAVWTTTPWTLASSQAVAINKSFMYSCVKVQGKKNIKNIIIAKSLLHSVLLKYDINSYQILGEIQGSALEGLVVLHPFYEKSLPVLFSQHVSLKEGTGCVHMSPAHGVDDFYVCEKHNIKAINLIDAGGFYKESLNTKYLSKKNIFEVNDIVNNLLLKNNTMILSSKFNHSYPHCWRHKSPLIQYATFQWFISMEQNGLRKEVFKNINHIEWIPKWGKDRISLMLQRRPDWCISRQRLWSTPLCFIINRNTKKLHPDQVNISYKVAESIEKYGLDAWYNLKLEDILCKEDAKLYEKSKDGLDVWFDSGIVHYFFKNKRLQNSKNVIYFEGNDQYRGWFMSSLITSTAISNYVPSSKILSHGFTGDADGKKMSKSLGNVIKPEDVTDKYGADILRLWVASLDHKKEQHISDIILERVCDAYRRIRNTARFLLSNTNDFVMDQHMVSIQDMVHIDAWIIKKSFELQTNVISLQKNFRFSEIYAKINHFCINILGSFYLDIIKDRLYTTKRSSLIRRSCQTALQYILEILVRCISPILSFTAEEIWSNMHLRKSDSVFLSSWLPLKFHIERAKDVDNNFWDDIIKIKGNLNKKIEFLKKSKLVKSSLDLKVKLYCNDFYYKLLSKLGREGKFVFIISELNIIEARKLKEKNANNIIKCMPGIYIETIILDEKKCERCWHRVDDIGKREEYRDICMRCISNINNEGEVRKIV